MIRTTKKLVLALKLKDWDKLSDGDRMTLHFELNNCSPEERNEINEMVFILNRHDDYKIECYNKTKENNNLLF